MPVMQPMAKEQKEEQLAHLELAKLYKHDRVKDKKQSERLAMGGKALIHCLGKHGLPKHCVRLLKFLVAHQVEQEWWQQHCKSAKAAWSAAKLNHSKQPALSAYLAMEDIRRKIFELEQLSLLESERLERCKSELQVALYNCNVHELMQLVLDDLVDPELKQLLSSYAEAKVKLARLSGLKGRGDHALEEQGNDAKQQLAAVKAQIENLKKQPLDEAIANNPIFPVWSAFYSRFHKDNEEKVIRAFKDVQASMEAMHGSYSSSSSSAAAAAEPVAVDLD